jgi:hypothetical protein
VGEVSPLNELYRRHRNQGFEFFTIYVREPHPGENYGPHRSWEQKLRFARQCQEQDRIENPMLVDDLKGTVHRRYGLMPNMVYIIDKNGKIAYKAMWTDHEEISSVLANLVSADELQAQGVASSRRTRNASTTFQRNMSVDCGRRSLTVPVRKHGQTTRKFFPSVQSDLKGGSL